MGWALNGPTATIDLEDGSSIAVSVQRSGYLSAVITLAPVHYQKVSGHCGPWDDSSDPTKIYCKSNSWVRLAGDGKLNVQNVNTWADCWRVAETHNCFKGKIGNVQNAVDGSPYVPQVCRIPDDLIHTPVKPCPKPPAPYNPCDYANGGCAGSNNTYTPPSPPSYVKTCAITEKEASDWCAKALPNNDGCEKVCDNTRAEFLSACVKDSLHYCNYAMADDHRTTYYMMCERQTDYLRNSYDPQITYVAEKVRQEVGYGAATTCPSNCNGRGTCSEYGCQCKDGFSGMHCETDLTKAQTYDIGVPLVKPVTNEPVKNPLTTAYLNDNKNSAGMIGISALAALISFTAIVF